MATVLIVEDELDHLQILRDMLSRCGHSAITAFGAVDAVRKAKARRPDLILTDLAMPTVNGVQLIDMLKSDPETRRIPVVAVTAHINLGQAAGTAGADGFIAKPFNLSRLREELSKHLPSAPQAVAASR